MKSLNQSAAELNMKIKEIQERLRKIVGITAGK
jgi:hypothetical protein